MTTSDTDATPAADIAAAAILLREALAIADSSGRTPARIALAVGGASVEVDWSQTPAAAAPQPLALTGAPSAVVPAAGADDGGAMPGIAVESPLVGTFYRAPSPEADPFVSVGDVVEEGQTIAIVEAMKLMNTITAPERGRISAILPEDGDRVEFGQPLVRLVPLGTDAA
ncbi:acetyl-CoA carboxylase biotin carboxyl carrier protein [Sinomonas mesophila]|uniref:acetyl-CoA carboxylase biotin carboxyl carrier protein n=1 Tax=Sinomonas mesophila TaxID=1531955 RepID=UPI000987A8E6|nr:biotin/lipoyl-containing protein [Sinomonas mesophila]